MYERIINRPAGVSSCLLVKLDVKIISTTDFKVTVSEYSTKSEFTRQH